MLISLRVRLQGLIKIRRRIDAKIALRMGEIAMLLAEAVGETFDEGGVFIKIE